MIYDEKLSQSIGGKAYRLSNGNFYVESYGRVPPLDERLSVVMDAVVDDEVDATITVDLRNLYYTEFAKSMKISYDASCGCWTCDSRTLHDTQYDWYNRVTHIPWSLAKVKTDISARITWQSVCNIDRSYVFKMDVEYTGIPRKHRKQMSAVLAEFMERWSVLPPCAFTGFCGGHDFLNAQEDFNTSKKARIC